MFKRVTIVALVVAAFLVLAVPALAWNGLREDYTATAACQTCHSGTAGIANVYHRWSETGHANAGGRANRLPYGSSCGGCHSSNFDPSKIVPTPTATSSTGAVSWTGGNATPIAPQAEGNAATSESFVGCSSCHYGANVAGGLAIYGVDSNDTAHMAPLREPRERRDLRPVPLAVLLRHDARPGRLCALHDSDDADAGRADPEPEPDQPAAAAVRDGLPDAGRARHRLGPGGSQHRSPGPVSGVDSHARSGCDHRCRPPGVLAARRRGHSRGSTVATTAPPTSILTGRSRATLPLSRVSRQSWARIRPLAASSATRPTTSDRRGSGQDPADRR